MKTKNLKDNKGITLIALVITIIVLIILAAVSIAMLTGKGGIISNATGAKKLTGIAKIDEVIDLSKSAAKAMEPYGEITYDNIVEQLNKNIGVKGKDYTITPDEDEGKVATEWIVNVKEINKDYTISGQAEKSESGLSEFANDDTTPYYPDNTFTRVADTDLDNGLVIADSQGNEWVWVEVPKNWTKDATTVPEITAALKTHVEDYRESYAQDWTDEYYDGCGLTQNEYNSLYSKMINSIKENGGFWIGRYEVGDATATASKTARTENTGIKNTPVVKPDQIPYNYVTCPEAQILSKKFSQGKDYSSSLLFGIQWDLTCKFLETKATNPGSSASSIKAAINTNSKDWGNYKDASFKITKGMYSEDYGDTFNAVSGTYNKEANKNVLLTTGATDRNSLMNIYDFAGNDAEWTGEKVPSESVPSAVRGGYYSDNGSYSPAKDRNNGYRDDSINNFGFRPSLYK